MFLIWSLLKIDGGISQNLLLGAFRSACAVCDCPHFDDHFNDNGWTNGSTTYWQIDLFGHFIIWDGVILLFGQWSLPRGTRDLSSKKLSQSQPNYFLQSTELPVQSYFSEFVDFDDQLKKVLRFFIHSASCRPVVIVPGGLKSFFLSLPLFQAVISLSWYLLWMLLLFCCLN